MDVFKARPVLATILRQARANLYTSGGVVVDKESKRKEVLLKWAKKNGLIVCKKESIYSLVQIMNEVALGIDAHVDAVGDVHFNHVEGFDYQEMVGLKLIIHSDPKFRVCSKTVEEADDETEEDDAD